MQGNTSYGTLSAVPICGHLYFLAKPDTQQFATGGKRDTASEFLLLFNVLARELEGVTGARKTVGARQAAQMGSPTTAFAGSDFDFKKLGVSIRQCILVQVLSGSYPQIPEVRRARVMKLTQVSTQ